MKMLDLNLNVQENLSFDDKDEDKEDLLKLSFNHRDIDIPRSTEIIKPKSLDSMDHFSEDDHYDEEFIPVKKA